MLLAVSQLVSLSLSQLFSRSVNRSVFSQSVSQWVSFFSSQSGSQSVRQCLSCVWWLMLVSLSPRQWLWLYWVCQGHPGRPLSGGLGAIYTKDRL